MTKNDSLKDMRIILYYTGNILVGVALLTIIPLLTALFEHDAASAADFSISLGVTLTLGATFCLLGNKGEQAGWKHGMVTVAFSWLVATVVAAIPYWLSGHFSSYLDCVFDVMSGFTTTGITLVQDLDHVPDSLNMWRHLITFVGGQGIVVLALALFADKGGGYGFYVGEGKDERLFPSVLHTAKAIWRISLLYLVLGTIAMWVVCISIGMDIGRGFLHALWIFMASWSTGGFAPMSQNMLYYHSRSFELVTFIFFIVGSFNFALHAAVLKGDRKELLRNLETMSFGTTMSLLSFFTAWGLVKCHVYPNLVGLISKGFYQLASAHTTTGFMTIYPQQFVNEWGDIAILAVIIAMMFGGSACSTAGGFKGLRVGILFKALIQDTRRLLGSSKAIVIQKYHYHGDRTLGEQQVRSAALVVLMYMGIFAVGTLAGCMAGYPLLLSAFEAASATGNVGLTIGVSSPSMPAFLKLVYIFNMWAGRLEFMAILASAGFVASLFRGGRHVHA